MRMTTDKNLCVFVPLWLPIQLMLVANLNGGATLATTGNAANGSPILIRVGKRPAVLLRERLADFDSVEQCWFGFRFE